MCVICELRVLRARVCVCGCPRREADHQGTRRRHGAEPRLIWEGSKDGREWVMGTNTEEKETSTQIIISIFFFLQSHRCIHETFLKK